MTSTNTLISKLSALFYAWEISLPMYLIDNIYVSLISIRIKGLCLCAVPRGQPLGSSISAILTVRLIQSTVHRTFKYFQVSLEGISVKITAKPTEKLRSKRLLKTINYTSLCVNVGPLEQLFRLTALSPGTNASAYQFLPQGAWWVEIIFPGSQQSNFRLNTLFYTRRRRRKPMHISVHDACVGGIVWGT